MVSYPLPRSSKTTVSPVRVNVPVADRAARVVVPMRDQDLAASEKGRRLSTGFRHEDVASVEQGRGVTGLSRGHVA